jgi:hypothetical protein
MSFAAHEARALYAAPGHLMCTTSGHRQYRTYRGGRAAGPIGGAVGRGAGGPLRWGVGRGLPSKQVSAPPG